jgi:predicted aspartyl protease
MRQETFINIKKNYFLLFTFLILLFGCSSQRVVITKKQYVNNGKNVTIYTDWKEAVANNDFLSARKFPLSVPEENLIEGYELLLTQKVIKAEKILIELWRTDSIYNEDALSILYEYYFYHTKWDDFMSLVEMTGNFPIGYESVKDYYNFPQEKIIFPLGDSVFVPIHKFNYGNTPVVEVLINGKKKYFIVDTGASISAVSSEVAKECGIMQGNSAIGMRDVNNVLKKSAASPAYIRELKINNLNILNHPIFVSDNLKLKILGITVYKIDGIIGWSLLQKLKVRIDYQNKNILLSRSEKKNRNREMLNGIKDPFITTTATNGNKLFLQFDTGAQGISLFDNAKKKLEQKVSSEKTVTSFGVNENLRAKEGIIENFSFFIGNYIFNLSEISVSKTKVSEGNLIHLNGRIGNSPFLNGIISFDYQNGIFEYSKSK